MTLDCILHNFLLFQKLKGNTKQTYDYYKKRIGYFVTFCNNKDSNKLSIKDYNNYNLYLQNKKLSTFTIKTSLNAVKIFLKFAFKEGFINEDIALNIVPFKTTKKTIVVLSNAEINSIINSQNKNSLIGARNLLVISLMLDSGLRVSEVVNLNVEDINIDLNLIKLFGKGQKERLVPLTDSILDYYNNYLQLSKINYGALFPDTQTGKRITCSGISQILRRIKKQLNLKKLHPHYLRHTFATLFLVNGGDPVHLQLILGHETLYMTEHYLHIANQMTMSKQKKFSPLSNI